MANWNTHIYCANKVNEVLSFKDEALDMFLYGNLLPDVNPGWLIKPEVHIDQKVTHFEKVGQEYFWSAKRFMDKYDRRINKDNPLYLGYFFHIWLDICVMTDFVAKVPMSDLVCRGHEVREWKWNDMNVFIGKYSFDLSIDCIQEIVEAAKGIEEINITAKDLGQIPDFLHKLAKDNNASEYRFYDKRTFEDLYDRICRDFVKIFDGNITL